MFDQKLALKILINFLQLLLQHFILLQKSSLVLLDLVYNVWISLRLFFGIDLIDCLLLLLKILLSNTIKLSLERKVLFELLDLAVVIESLLLSCYNFIISILDLLILVLNFVLQGIDSCVFLLEFLITLFDLVLEWLDKRIGSIELDLKLSNL